MTNLKAIKNRLTPFWVICGLFLIATVFFTIETATEGAVLVRLEKYEKDLLEEKRSLESQLMQISSLTNLELRGKELGFGKPTKIIYVLEPAGVAKIPQP